VYAITGALGQTGSAVAKALLAAGASIRLIVRNDDDRSAEWRARGVEIVVADLTDKAGLARALVGIEGAYLMNPANYMAGDMFAEARRIHTSLINAANHAAVTHVVALSSVGAHQPAGTGNIATTWDFEQQLDKLHGRLNVLRAANFMENWAWSLHPVLAQGVLPTMFLPPERSLPMVAARDIGSTAAQLLLDTSDTRRLINLHGPQDYSPQDAGRTLGELLNKEVAVVAADEADWPGVFRGLGLPRNHRACILRNVPWLQRWHRGLRVHARDQARLHHTEAGVEGLLVERSSLTARGRSCRMFTGPPDERHPNTAWRHGAARGVLLMKNRIQGLLAAMAIAVCTVVSATGLATCDSGPKSSWQPIAKLEKQLSERGWMVRRVKEDGGCYEVYAIDDKGQRVEAYFHPVTLAPVPTRSR